MLNLLGDVKCMEDLLNQHFNYREAEMSPYFCYLSKNYAMGHAFTGKDLFMNFPVDKLKMSKEQCVEIYSDGNKRDLAEQIFIRSVQMVVDDIIDNNVHFKLPGLGRTQAYMYMKRTEGKKFKKAFKNGKWNDVDFITSNFSGYQLNLEMQSEKRLPREKMIYLSAKDKQRIIDHTNNGKQY